MDISQIKKYNESLTGNIDITKISIPILDSLMYLSFLYGKPLRFTSSFRTPQQNVACGGSPTSSHLKGLAFDIYCADSTSRYKLIQAINIMGIRRYGIYKTFIHIDFDAQKAQEVTWFG